jgi:hypothetical protein
MKAVKYREVWWSNGGGRLSQPRDEVVTEYAVAEENGELCIVLLDSRKRVKLSLSCFMPDDQMNEILQSWADWVFDRELLR